MSCGLILLAHGARDPHWAAPFQTVAEQTRAARPQAQVRLAFLELMAPSLAEAGADLAACGCTQVEILPLFLGVGGHVRRDLPRLLQALRAAQPQVRYRLHPAVGEIDGVIAALAAAAVATLAEPS
jgi:sirohydrochlorin cobaltochelatase